MIQQKRFDDEGWWKVFKLYPVIVGLILAIASMGGYFATVQYMNSEIKDLKTAVGRIQESALHSAQLGTRIVAIQEDMSKRIERLERVSDRRLP